MIAAKNKLLTILSEAAPVWPDFDDAQRLKSLALSEQG
jgi:hypothetical protein